MVGIQTFPFT